MKQASLKRKETVDISEEDAALILQKGRAHEGDNRNLIFGEPDSSGHTR